MSSSVGSLTPQTTPGIDMGPVPAAYLASKTFLNAVTVQYARELSDTGILINSGCPGFTATDLNGFRGVRTPQQGAAIAIHLATLPDDGPTGGFFDDGGTVPWYQALRPQGLGDAVIGPPGPAPVSGAGPEGLSDVTGSQLTEPQRGLIEPGPQPSSTCASACPMAADPPVRPAPTVGCRRTRIGQRRGRSG